MKRILIVLMALVGSLLGLVLMLAVFVDPRAVMIPFWLAAGGWREECERNPVAAYVSGQYYPCKGSPLTAENVNQKIPGREFCPLEWAAMYSRVDTTRELLQLGAKQEICGHDNDRLFQLVLVEGCQTEAAKRQLIETYEQAGFKFRDANALLLSAAREECPLGVRMALAGGASASARDSRGWSALKMVAAGSSKEEAEIVRLLVAAGADANEPSPSGETAYQMAERFLGKSQVWAVRKADLLGEGGPGLQPRRDSTVPP